MRRVSLFRAGLAVFAALGLAACQDNSGPSAPAARPTASAQLAQGAEPPSATELDRTVPGFGGYFLSQDGTPTVYLVGGAGRAPVDRALSAYLTRRGLTSDAVRVLEGRYTWRQLQRWQTDMTDPALSVPGAVFVDNDETTNRVKIGVTDRGAAWWLRAATTRLGIPTDAVVVENVDPIVQMATLQNVVDRPVRAGVQINFPGFLCSVGFNATSGGQQSFVTASHCTNVQGGVESTPYWQPLQSVDPTQIATEVADPQYSRTLPGCPHGNKRCRFSDASRAAYANGANQALGLIAATSGPNNGSLTITGSFTISADDCSTIGGCLPVGTTVNKVGRTTGWTQGLITNTCVNTAVSGSRIVQLCQTFVSAGVGGGDSGSDVFQVTGGTVKLAGILWGGNGAGTQFVFSPFGNVTSELGPLTTH
jgi:hypothetical protein